MTVVLSLGNLPKGSLYFLCCACVWVSESCGNIVMTGHEGPEGLGEPTSPTPNKMELKLKYGWPFPDMKDPPLSFRLKSGVVVPLVGTFSRILLSECHQPVRGSLVVLVSGAPLVFLGGSTTLANGACMLMRLLKTQNMPINTF